MVEVMGRRTSVGGLREARVPRGPQHVADVQRGVPDAWPGPWARDGLTDIRVLSIDGSHIDGIEARRLVDAGQLCALGLCGSPHLLEMPNVNSETMFCVLTLNTNKH